VSTKFGLESPEGCAHSEVLGVLFKINFQLGVYGLDSSGSG
jgi:hypothetical protein